MEKLAGAIWNQIKNLDDIEKKKEIIHNIFKRKEQIAYSLRSEKIGRTRKIDSLILEIDKVQYIFPNITPKFLTENLNKSRDIFFRNIGWFTLRATPNYLLDELYLKLNEVNEINKETFEREIGKFLKEKIYPIPRIANSLVTLFTEPKEFNGFLNIIEESIELFYLGYYRAAVAILIPCIEGICNKIYSIPPKKNERSFENAISKSLKEWNNMIYGDSHWISKEIKEDLYCYLDEFSSMQITFLHFMNNFLYLNSEKYHEKYPYLELNRHGISHGIFREYGTKSNWLILFSVLDFLTAISSKTKLMDNSETFEARSKSLLMEDISKIRGDILDLKSTNKYDESIRMRRILIDDLKVIIKDVMKLNNTIINGHKNSNEKFNLYLIDKLASLTEEKIRNDYNLYYMKNMDYQNKIIKLIHGSPNIHVYGRKKEKDLLILLINGAKATEKDLDNALFKFEMDLETGTIK